MHRAVYDQSSWLSPHGMVRHTSSLRYVEGELPVHGLALGALGVRECDGERVRAQFHG